MNRVLVVAWGARMRKQLRKTSLVALSTYALAGVCLVLCTICELSYLRTDIPVGFDESYIGALAMRLLDGRMLPGVDAVGQRGPAFYWIAALAQAVFGRYHWFGFRYVTWLAACVVVISLVGLGVLARRPLAGAIGAAFYVWICFSYYLPGTGAAMNGEQLVAPMLCVAALSACLAVRAERERVSMAWAAFAGFMAGLAGWTKITAFGGIAPLLIWAATMRVLVQRAPAQSTSRVLASLIAGWLMPVSAVPLLYLAAGELDALVYRFFTYNREIHMGVYAVSSVSVEIGRWFGSDPVPAYAFIACACFLLGSSGYLLGLRRRDLLRTALTDHAVITVALLFALLTFASGIVQMRFWGHHFIVAMPWAGLLLGFAIDALVRTMAGKLQPVASICVAAAVMTALVMTVGRAARRQELERRAGLHPRASSDPLCAEIHRYARSDDTIFIWGFDGDLYVSCARKPASRFVYTTLIAGIVPPFWTEVRPERVARDAPAQVAADLKRTKPVLILDIPAKLGGIRVTEVRELRSIVRNHYCKVAEVNGLYARTATFYARKSRGYCGKSRTSSK